jgi:predicted anti-sigma-YlaC factor YlaD
MRCDQAREVISARLDDEEQPGEAAALDAHLGGCAGCRHYAERAAQITRLVRLRPAEPGPDLVAAVVAAAPPARRGAGTAGVRLGLGAVGIGQFALAISAAADPVGRLAGLAHMSHESAAWNLALAVGFLWAATGATRRMSELVALVGAFVGVLTVLSVVDLVDGRVDPVRVATHLLVVAGLVLLLVMHRTDRRGGGGTGSRYATQYPPGTVDEPAAPARRPHAVPSAYHRAA